LGKQIVYLNFQSGGAALKRILIILTLLLGVGIGAVNANEPAPPPMITPSLDSLNPGGGGIQQPDIAPTSLVANRSGSSVTLTWVQSLNESTRYWIFRSFNGGSYDQITAPLYAGTYYDSNLPDGSYQYQIEMFGHARVESNLVIVDTTPPSLTNLSAVKTAPDSATVNISWESDDSNSIFRVRRYKDLIYTDIYEGPLTTIEDDNLSNGTYSYEVQATDVHGNTRVMTTLNDVVIDVPLPIAPALSIQKNQPNGRVVTLSWAENSSIAYYIIERELNSTRQPVHGSLTASTYVQTLESDGVYTYYLKSVDFMGNISAEWATASVTIDTTPPSISYMTISKPAANSPTINLTFYSPDPSLSHYIVRRFFSTGQLETQSFATRQGYADSGVSPIGFPSTIAETVSPQHLANNYSDKVPTDGRYFYQVTAVDTFGNRSTGPVTGVIVIDTTPPGMHFNFVGTTNAQTITVSWNMAEGTSRSVLLMAKNQAPVLGNPAYIVVNGTPRTKTLTDLDDGVYHFALYAVDSFNNYSDAQTLTITVNTTPTLERLSEQPEMRSGSLEVSTNVTVPMVRAKIGLEGQEATLNLQATFTTEGLELGVGANSLGHLLVASSNSNWVEMGDVVIGSNGGRGKIEHSSGSVSVNGQLVIGGDRNSTGNYTLSGGTLSANKIVLGNDGGSGTLSWTGGTIQAREVMGDIVNSGGTLDIAADRPMIITGNYVQASGTLVLGLNSGSGVVVRGGDSLDDATPLLRATGTIDLSGVLVVTQTNYDPQPGDKIRLVNRPSQTLGVRSRILSTLTFNLPDLGSQLQWDTSSFETEGTIQVTSTSTNLMPSRPFNFPNPFKMTNGTH